MNIKDIVNLLLVTALGGMFAWVISSIVFSKVIDSLKNYDIFYISNSNYINDNYIPESNKTSEKQNINQKNTNKYNTKEYKGGFFTEELINKGKENFKYNYINFSDKTFPIIQKFDEDIKINDIGRYYFNSGLFYKDGNPNKKVVVFYAHSNYGLGNRDWAGEEIIKLKEGNELYVNSLDGKNKKIKIEKTITISDDNLKKGINNILDFYYNGKYDLILYTCIYLEGKEKGKRFLIGKAI